MNNDREQLVEEIEDEFIPPPLMDINAPDGADTFREEEENFTGCGGSWLCHPDKLCHKIIALFLMCLLGFGSYFCFDNPGALQEEIKDTMNINTYQFSYLYAWYSWPNVVLPVIGGYLIDTVFGIRIGASFFAFTLVLGQALFTLGAYEKTFGLMEAGRFLFGVGGESLAVAQNTYAAAWFSGKILNMVFGLQLSVARLGSTVNFQTVEPLFRLFKSYMPSYMALTWTLALAGLTCVISFIASLILGLMDKRHSRIHRQNNENIEEHFGFRTIFKLPLTFWLICLICVFYYVAIFPFVSLGQAFYKKKYNMSSADANFINGLIYLISAFASPIFGICIDKLGRNLTFVFLSILTSICGHSLLAFTLLNPYIGVVMISLAYSSLASALWPMMTLIVNHSQLGTAFGLMQAIQNLGLALISTLAGYIVDNYGYLWLEEFFLMWLILAVICTIILYCIDFRSVGILNMSVNARNNYQNEINERRTKLSEPE